MNFEVRWHIIPKNDTFHYYAKGAEGLVKVNKGEPLPIATRRIEFLSLNQAAEYIEKNKLGDICEVEPIWVNVKVEGVR